MRRGLLLANVIEFDQSWGHRNDVAGISQGSARARPRPARDFCSGVREEDLVIFTADHGNDPTTPSTDHSREVVPLLVMGPGSVRWDLGRRSTFADIGQTVAEFLGVAAARCGHFFLVRGLE